MQEQQEIEALRAKVEDLEARNRELTSEPPRPRQRWRGILAAVLIIVSVLIAPAAAVSTWVRAQLIDTDRFVSTFAPLAQDPAIQDYVSDQAMAGIEANVDIDGIVGDVFDGIAELDLPSQASAALPLLEAPAASGVRSLIGTSIDRIITSDQFAGLWEGALRETHGRAIAVLQNDPSTMLELGSDGTLSLRLGLLIGEVKEMLTNQGLGFAGMIPEVDRSVPLVASESLAQVRSVYQIAVAGGYWLPWVVLALLVTGVLVARNRPRALAWGGFGMAAVFLLLSFGMWIGRGYFVGSVSPSLMPADAAVALFSQLTELMHSTIVAIIVLSLFMGVAAWLAGRSRRAAAIRDAADSGFSAVRTAAERKGLGTGAFGLGLERWKQTIRIATVLLGVAVLFLNRPVTTGKAIATLAIVLGVLLVLELLRRPGASRGAPDTPADPASTAAPAASATPAATDSTLDALPGESEGRQASNGRATVEKK